MRFSILSFCLFVSTTAFAQQDGIGIHFGGNDFYGPQTGHYFLVNQNKINYAPDNLKNDTTTRHVFLWQPLVRVSYWKRLNSWIDVNLGLSLSNAEYPTSKNDTAFQLSQLDNYGPRTDHFLGELDAKVNYNILARRTHMFAPYVSAGLALSYHSIFCGVDFPVGVGINVHMIKSKDIYLNLEASYKAALSSNDYNHLQYTAGFVFWFKHGHSTTKTAEAKAPGDEAADENSPEAPHAKKAEKNEE